MSAARYFLWRPAFTGNPFPRLDRKWPLLAACLIVFPTWEMTDAAAVDGITLAAHPDDVLVPIAEAGREWKLPLKLDRRTGLIAVGEISIPSAAITRLVDGTAFVSVPDLVMAGAMVIEERPGEDFTVTVDGRSLSVTTRAKRVEINLAAQQLRAWQGDRLVLQSRISSGRYGSTPSGNFEAGPYKARMHYSTRYHNAPMPWSVQINRHVFIHGFTSVPGYPASHGCIRLPLDEGNPAKFFYQWVDVGTPVKIMRR